MENVIRLLKREISSNDITLINDLIEDYGHKGRTFISKELCRIWDWRNPNGQYRDIICRDLLRRLDKRKLIQLPPPLKAARKPGYKNHPILPKDFKAVPINQSLRDFEQLNIVMVRGSKEERLYNALINSYHYLGYHQGNGEQLKYIIKGDGHILAAIGFGGAAYKIAHRDKYIGWNNTQKENNLGKVVNNNRFLIMPWVKVPHLASHILGRVSRRIIRDWQGYYQRGIVLLETFVERERFIGTSYKAANWVYLGHTTGRGRNNRSKKDRVPLKDIYIYPLKRKYRDTLCALR